MLRCLTSPNVSFDLGHTGQLPLAKYLKKGGDGFGVCVPVCSPLDLSPQMHVQQGESHLILCLKWHSSIKCPHIHLRFLQFSTAFLNGLMAWSFFFTNQKSYEESMTRFV
jgi:hypothetical protein